MKKHIVKIKVILRDFFSSIDYILSELSIIYNKRKNINK